MVPQEKLHSGIIGAGYYVPPKVLTNADLEKMVDTSDEWIRTRTGILERHIAAKGVGTSDLGAAAALNALENAKIKADEVDLIICATTTPDMPFPSSACLVQQKIGAKKAAAFDLAAACAGFVYALVTADQYIKSGTYHTVLVIGADIVTTYIDKTDRSTCVLFGDGAGAVVMRAVDKGGILSSVLGSDGQYAGLLRVEGGGSLIPATEESVRAKSHFLKMEGGEVFKLAVRGMHNAVVTALEKAGVKTEEVACFIPHQANLRIIDAVGDRIGCAKEKVFVNLQKYGNTSAASCAIALSEALIEGKIKKKDKIVLATFGSGLVWGAMVIEWVI